MDQRSNRNLFGCVDWTTGLLLNDTTAEGYQQQGLQAGGPSVASSNHPSTYLTPSYTAPEINNHNPATRAGTSFQNLSPGPSSLIDTSPGEVFYSNHPPDLNATQQQQQQRPLFEATARNSTIRAVNTKTSMPGPSHIPRGVRSDSFAMNKDKVRVAKKRGTSVMSESDSESRSYKFQRSLSSASAAEFEDAQSHYSSVVDGEEEEAQEDMRMSSTSSPTPSEEPRNRGGRQNHSEIEKRRRDKMNTYITELSRVVPMCITMSHKLDKLTVLRMAVQHLKTIRGAIHSYTEGDYKPAFLSDEELKRLILKSAEGFLFVVGCDRGRMLYVSESVCQVLNYSQGDLLGQSWFDILHPKDVAKVKEQLSSSDLSPRERLIDAKTMLPVKTDVPQGLSRLCPGARRSFYCRMKYKAANGAQEQSDSGSSKHRKSQSMNKEKKYMVVHCTGYLKSWAPAKIGMHDQDGEGDVDACNLSCLVAVGRVQPSTVLEKSKNESRSGNNSRETDRLLEKAPPAPSIEFTSRHAIDGNFVFVDQRATLLLGILPQELLGTSMYEYFHVEDIAALTEKHKAALQTTEVVTTAVYRFRTKEGTYVRLQTRWKSFRNPWTKDIEFIVAKNSYLSSENIDSSTSDVAASNYSEMFYPSPGDGIKSSNGSVRGRPFNMDLKASKIGKTVADEVLDSHRRSCSSMSSSTVRSPGSLFSVSAAASPFSNVGSPLDSDSSLLVAAVLTSSFSNEDGHRNAAGNGTAAATTSNAANSDEVLSNSNGSTPSQTQRNNSNHAGHNHIKVRNNTQLLHILDEAGLHADEDMMEVIGGLMMDQSASSSSETTGGGDGNDEAAMAVVMSLLEADAGLGGPVDFSGLPWPLP